MSNFARKLKREKIINPNPKARLKIYLKEQKRAAKEKLDDFLAELRKDSEMANQVKLQSAPN